MDSVNHTSYDSLAWNQNAFNRFNDASQDVGATSLFNDIPGGSIAPPTTTPPHRFECDMPDYASLHHSMPRVIADGGGGFGASDALCAVPNTPTSSSSNNNNPNNIFLNYRDNFRMFNNDGDDAIFALSNDNNSSAAQARSNGGNNNRQHHHHHNNNSNSNRRQRRVHAVSKPNNNNHHNNSSSADDQTLTSVSGGSGGSNPRHSPSTHSDVSSSNQNREHSMQNMNMNMNMPMAMNPMMMMNGMMGMNPMMSMNPLLMNQMMMMMQSMMGMGNNMGGGGSMHALNNNGNNNSMMNVSQMKAMMASLKQQLEQQQQSMPDTNFNAAAVHQAPQPPQTTLPPLQQQQQQAPHVNMYAEAKPFAANHGNPCMSHGDKSTFSLPLPLTFPPAVPTVPEAVDAVEPRSNDHIDHETRSDTRLPQFLPEISFVDSVHMDACEQNSNDVDEDDDLAQVEHRDHDDEEDSDDDDDEDDDDDLSFKSDVDVGNCTKNRKKSTSLNSACSSNGYTGKKRGLSEYEANNDDAALHDELCGGDEYDEFVENEHYPEVGIRATSTVQLAKELFVSAAAAAEDNPALQLQIAQEMLLRAIEQIAEHRWIHEKYQIDADNVRYLCFLDESLRVPREFEQVKPKRGRPPKNKKQKLDSDRNMQEWNQDATHDKIYRVNFQIIFEYGIAESVRHEIIQCMKIDLNPTSLSMLLSHVLAAKVSLTGNVQSYSLYAVDADKLKVYEKYEREEEVRKKKKREREQRRRESKKKEGKKINTTTSKKKK